MKLTDEKILEALKAGKRIRLCGGTNKYCLNKKGDIVIDGENNFISLNVAVLSYDFEIVEQEFDWDRIIKDKVLCIFNYMDNITDLYCYYPILGHLIEYDPDKDYKFTGVMIDSCKANFRQCRPFNPENFNIAENPDIYKKEQSDESI